MALGTSTSGDRRRAKNKNDVRAWLLQNGHEKVAAQIDQLERKWRVAGKKTRRNWWAVLAGNKSGLACKVEGVAFPVLKAAQIRQGRKVPQRVAVRRRAASPSKAAGRRQPEPVSRDVVQKASLSLSRARPFVKWAGGKRQLLQEILRRLPADYGTFHEPFVGGGAVFFALQPARAVLSDMNERLIRTYRGIKYAVEDVIALLKTYPHNKKFFLQMREKAIDAASDAEVAAWFIFLNKTGFNGLYRVNSKNKFNVPFGDNVSMVYEEEHLRACAAALANAELNCEDFSAVLERAQPGDIVYFDPPYVPLSVTSSFTSYTARGFDLKDQLRLRDLALELRKRDVFVLLSNSSAPAVHELYQSRFECIPVSVSRTVNSDAKGRGRITELLIT